MWLAIFSTRLPTTRSTADTHNYGVLPQPRARACGCCARIRGLHLALQELCAARGSVKSECSCARSAPATLWATRSKPAARTVRCTPWLGPGGAGRACGVHNVLTARRHRRQLPVAVPVRRGSAAWTRFKNKICRLQTARWARFATYCTGWLHPRPDLVCQFPTSMSLC